MNPMNSNIFNDFNNLLLQLITNIKTICPRSIVARNFDVIEYTITNIKDNERFIGLFVTKALKYKKFIDEENEKFFTEKSYEEDVNKNKNKNVIDHIFQLKDVWGILSEENKKIIFKYMQILCHMAQKYFDILDKKNQFEEDIIR
uniref:Uncharacterized protein n=1 Tax=Mimivirus LCMiAC02 TaxID=2506609 RepID=A0A4D5XF54_9VIRU|nr:MAG: hypothetical protein LCMiAC02_03780 [Mimivirus LCMiAC02]